MSFKNKSQNPAILDQRITFQKQVKESDGMGGHEISWVDHKSIAASCKPKSGNEKHQNLGEIRDEATISFTIRNQLKDLDSSMRILWNEKPYDITYIPDVNPRDLYLEIQARRYE